MKYVGTYRDPKDIVTKEKLDAVASRVSTNEDNIAMAESDIDGLQTTVGTLQTNINNVQTALTSKQDVIVGAASTITEDNLATDRALVSNSSGKVAVSNVTSTELGYLDGVTSNVQTQLDKKLESVPVTSVNGATGDVKSTFYVTVTQGDDGSITADKTAAEVYATYAAGYAVYANFNGITVPLAVAAQDSMNMLLAFGAVLANSPEDSPAYVNVLFNGLAWQVWRGELARLEDIPAIPTALKNPYSLNIKIGKTTTRYDGSATETVEIPEGVPAVTTADNGKFLRVVNGSWAAVEIANANGGSF